MLVWDARKRQGATRPSLVIVATMRRSKGFRATSKADSSSIQLASHATTTAVCTIACRLTPDRMMTHLRSGAFALSSVGPALLLLEAA